MCSPLTIPFSTILVLIFVISPAVQTSAIDPGSATEIAKPKENLTPRKTAKPLDGISIRCCLVSGYPHVIPQFTPGRTQPNPLKLGNYKGLAVDFFSQLLDHSGLSCLKITHFSNRTGTGHNDFINDLLNCTEQGKATDFDDCECDIGIGGWFETTNRVNVKFLAPYIHDDVKVAINNMEVEGDASDELFFINAFDLPVWGALLLLIVLFVFIKLLDTRFASRPTEYEPAPCTVSIWRRARHFLLKNQKSYRIRRAVQSTLSNLLGFIFLKTEGEDRSMRQWILNYVIALVGLFLILTYEATMTATLVSETTSSKFRSRKDLDNCRIAESEICLLRGDFMENQWDSTFAQSLCRLEGAPSDRNTSVTRYDDLESIVDAVYKRECKYMIGSGGQVAFATEKYCGTVIATGRGFLQRGLSMVVPLNSPYFGKLNNETLKLYEERQNLTSINDFVERSGNCGQSPAVQLQIGKMRVYFIGAFAMCLLLLAEMLLDPQEAGKNEDEGTSDNSQADSQPEPAAS